MLRVAPDRRLDPTDGRRDAPGDEGLVRLADSARLELGHERLLRRVVLGDHQQAARVAVEPVDDAGPRDPGDAAVLRSTRPGQQRVHERVAVVMAGRRMDDETGRLVDDEQVVVLVDDPERDVRRGRQIERDGLRDVETHLGARRHEGVGADRDTVDRQPTVGDELLDVAPRQTRGIGDEPVDPTGGPVGDAHGPDAGGDRRLRHPATPVGRGRSTTNALSRSKQDRPRLIAESATLNV